MKLIDEKVAVFASSYAGGDVGLWYCPHREVYELKYDVALNTPDGVMSAAALASYSATDYDQVVDVLVDAIDIARTPLLERD